MREVEELLTGRYQADRFRPPSPGAGGARRPARAAAILVGPRPGTPIRRDPLRAARDGPGASPSWCWTDARDACRLGRRPATGAEDYLLRPARSLRATARLTLVLGGTISIRACPSSRRAVAPTAPRRR